MRIPLDMRQIEQHATQLRIARENRRQQVARRPTDIDQRAYSGEVVGGRDGRRLPAMKPNHRLAKERGLIRMLREILEQRHPRGLLLPGLPGLQAIGKLAHHAPEMLAAEGENGGPRGSRSIALERLAERGQSEMPCRALREESQARESSHEAVQRGRVGARRSGQLRGGLRAAAQMIRQTDLGGAMNDHRDPGGRAHLDELNMRRNGLGGISGCSGHGLPSRFLSVVWEAYTLNPWLATEQAERRRPLIATAAAARHPPPCASRHTGQERTHRR